MCISIHLWRWMRALAPGYMCMFLRMRVCVYIVRVFWAQKNNKTAPKVLPRCDFKRDCMPSSASLFVAMMFTMVGRPFSNAGWSSSQWCRLVSLSSGFKSREPYVEGDIIMKMCSQSLLGHVGGNRVPADTRTTASLSRNFDHCAQQFYGEKDENWCRIWSSLLIWTIIKTWTWCAHRQISFILFTGHFQEGCYLWVVVSGSEIHEQGVPFRSLCQIQSSNVIHLKEKWIFSNLVYIA